MKKLGNIIALWLVILIVLTTEVIIVGCQQKTESVRISPASPPGSPSTTPLSTTSSINATISITDIWADPDIYEGSVVTLEATYSGWKGGLAGAPPETRSDWLLEDETGWIYVTGKPSGLDPIDDIGYPIKVTGLIKLTNDGEPYLVAQEIYTEQSYSTVDLINRAYQNGEIDYDERVLYIVYSIYTPEALPEEYLSDVPVKSATPLILEIQRNWDRLSPETQEKISPYIQPLTKD